MPRPPGRKSAGREGADTRKPRGKGRGAGLPRRSGPEGETAAGAGPAGGHSGGARGRGPEREPCGHSCPGFDALHRLKGAWVASLASQPRWTAEHLFKSALTRRECQLPGPAKAGQPEGGGAVTQKHSRRSRAFGHAGSELSDTPEVSLRAGTFGMARRARNPGTRDAASVT